MISHLLHRFYQIIQETIFPPKCLVCETFFRIPGQSRRGILTDAAPDRHAGLLPIQVQMAISLAAFLCSDCLAGLVAVESPLCIVCGIPFKSRLGQDHTCGACIASPKNFGIARAPLVYETIITKVIHGFKYRGKIQLAKPLGELLLTSFMLFWDKDSIDIIVPVPLHIKRLRSRGFNQAYLLIRNWPAMAAGCSYDPSGFRIEHDVLIRDAHTLPQTAFGHSQRAVNIKNAFDLKSGEKIVDKRILLVDDVYTTGATADECARLLLNRGARQVDVLTLARTI